MKEKEFHYQWWGKGDIDASLGIFFDGFSKVLTAVGILTAVFGMPMADVIGKVVPGIGISIFVGNMWYFFEACQLAKKEKRQKPFFHRKSSSVFLQPMWEQRKKEGSFL